MNTAMMKKNVKSMFASWLTVQKSFMLFSPKAKKSFSKKTLEGEFFEDLIQRVFITAQQISKIYWMCRGRMMNRF